jgi:hypothetical protein
VKFQREQKVQRLYESYLSRNQKANKNRLKMKDKEKVQKHKFS